MQRVIAILLVLLLSLPLIVTAAPASTQSKLPSCCRRDGKHKCAAMVKDTASRGPIVQALRAKCAAFPNGNLGPAGQLSVLAPTLEFSSPALMAIEVIAQLEALHRISYQRTRQKRGPPSLLL